MNCEGRAPDLPAELARALVEPIAFALLTWPAAALAVHWSTPGETGWRIAALIWLAIFHLAAYGRGRGAAFGNTMLLLSGIVAVAWTTFPAAWAFVAFPLLLIGLHGAQRALLRRSSQGAGGPHEAIGPVESGD